LGCGSRAFVVRYLGGTDRDGMRRLERLRLQYLHSCNCCQSAAAQQQFVPISTLWPVFDSVSRILIPVDCQFLGHGLARPSALPTLICPFRQPSPMECQDDQHAARSNGAGETCQSFTLLGFSQAFLRRFHACPRLAPQGDQAIRSPTRKGRSEDRPSSPLPTSHPRPSLSKSAQIFCEFCHSWIFRLL
jgi:hypothetical protein